MILYDEELTGFLLDQSFKYRDFRDIFSGFELKKTLVKRSTRLPKSVPPQLKVDEFNSRKEGTTVLLPFSMKSEYDVAVWIDLSPTEIRKFIYLKNFL